MADIMLYFKTVYFSNFLPKKKAALFFADVHSFESTILKFIH